MLKLKNLKKNNGIISAEYDPENSGELGSISIDIEKETVVDFNISKLDGAFPIYANHAVDALMKIMHNEELPTEKLVMWY